MMLLRIACLFALTLISGCTLRHSQLSHCSVFAVLGGESVPLGLVTLPPDLEAELRLQLSPPMSHSYICWYVSGDELIAAEKANPESFVYGEVFRLSGSRTWEHSGEHPRILAVPRLIQ
jgi:hypothetical protein